MSRTSCIRSCGRKKRAGGLLCAQCASKELARRNEQGRPVKPNEKRAYSLPPTSRVRGW
jgi:hypothetical protein